jgi:tripartite-type tricarboxylate transporter receptor subunit TctC
MIRALHIATLFAAVGIVGAPALHAQSAWPAKPVRVVLPYPPGGPSDLVTRAVGGKMLATLKQPLVIENKPGAGGNIGSAEVARAAADGYTWLVALDTQFTVNPHVYKSLGFKPESLVPVATLTQFGQTLVCNPTTQVKTLAELIAKAKAEKMTYASGGAGVPGHLTMELLQSLAGFEMTHVPYKGPAPATQDVIGGQVPCGFLAGPTVLPHVRSGRLVALAVSGVNRSPLLPDVPTVVEAGVKGYAASFTLIAFAPRGTPDPIVERFRQALGDALQQPDVIEQLRATDQVVLGGSADAAARMLATDFQKWGEVARRIKLGLD